MAKPVTGSRFLLGSGVAAGILVPLVVLIDGATRPGYSLLRNGVSQLGTGERAWLFGAAFVLGGVLIGLFAVGIRRTLGQGRGAVWGPIMLAVAAVGFIVGGLVPTDPALGYPPGAPEGITASGAIHQVAGTLIFVGLPAAAFVVARRLREDGRCWAIYARLTGALIIAFALAAGIAYRLDALGVWRPAAAGLLEQLSLLAGYVWLIAIGVHYLRSRSTEASRD